MRCQCNCQPSWLQHVQVVQLCWWSLWIHPTVDSTGHLPVLQNKHERYIDRVLTEIRHRFHQRLRNTTSGKIVHIVKTCDIEFPSMMPLPSMKRSATTIKLRSLMVGPHVSYELKRITLVWWFTIQLAHSQEGARLVRHMIRTCQCGNSLFSHSVICFESKRANSTWYSCCACSRVEFYILCTRIPRRKQYDTRDNNIIPIPN